MVRALLLSLIFSIPAAAGESRYFTIEGAGWKVAEPRGFKRVEKWAAGTDQEWSREWTDSVRWAGEKRRVLQIEYISVKFLGKFEIDLRTKRAGSPAAFKVCRGSEPKGRQKEGRHKKHRTLTYSCRNEAENLFPSVDHYYEFVIRSGRGHADVIQLGYRHRARLVDEDWEDIRGRYRLSRRMRHPSMKIFRAMQKSLQPVPVEKPDSPSGKKSPLLR